MRRIDDVIWLWCTYDLLEKQGESADWAWFYSTGQEFFSRFYQPFQDLEDGLYCLKAAIRKELRLEDGTFAYFKHRQGELEVRREALGSALVVLCGIVEGEDAQRALQNFPVTDGGVPLFHPFFDLDNWYHNNSSWPFVDTFFLQALEMSDGVDRTAQNAALLARTCMGDGTFHEVTDYRTREVKGSSSQLWTAASFINVCLRSGLWK